jgi:hypothetical protein
MNTHPYLRAYMAGITVPTMIFLPLGLSAFTIVRFGMGISVPIERLIVFPMAVVPNLFGVWNILYVAVFHRRSVPIGPYGAILPFLLMPLGALLATHLGFLTLRAHEIVWFGALHVPYATVAAFFCMALAIYYLVWKYLVGGLNGILGIA